LIYPLPEATKKVKQEKGGIAPYSIVRNPKRKKQMRAATLRNYYWYCYAAV